MEDTKTLIFSPWNLSYALSKDKVARLTDPLLSTEFKDITMITNYFIICGSMAVCGVVANVVNLIIFTKLGYDTTMNISLAGIAVSDLCTLLFLIWFDVCHSPHLQNSKDVSISFELMYLTAGWPHCLFARITCVITVYITIERFLCVAIPLKVKNVITKPKTVIIVLSLFISQLLTIVPIYFSNYVDWKFFPEQNRSLLGMYRKNNWEKIETISFALHSTMQLLSFGLLIFFTALLLISLAKKAKWRRISTNETISTRDKRLLRMVVLIAVILIVCLTPGIMCFSAMAIEPEYTMGGFYDNVFYVSWSFAFIFQTFNSSVNIFVYYNMSSKYRDKFHETFTLCRKLFYGSVA